MKQSTPVICPIHPKYRGYGKPYSKKKGCICEQIYTAYHKDDLVVRRSGTKEENE